ncbi:ABC transporter substrate-binding protein [Microbacterium sp. BWT-B31]|uniref:ABC transporter substrate-binding protein n=1 Tax=Microbacterium sp. BWT-B31 TaxID=3232072 RepID=UPI0035288493
MNRFETCDSGNVVSQYQTQGDAQVGVFAHIVRSIYHLAGEPHYSTERGTMHITRTKRAAIALGSTALFIAALSGCAANGDPGGGDGENKLEITSWWTSGSEADALNVLIDAVKTADPGLTVENAAVSGGGGANARQALAARLQAGDPPDAWQLHPAGQLASYVAGNQVGDLSMLWEDNGWEADVPEGVAAAQQVDGKYYTVPIGVHRGNVLWTNPSVLEAAGVSIDPGGSLDDLLDSLQKVADSGTTAVCLGDKDVFASAELLESILMSRLGSEKWDQLFTNDYSFDSREVRQALEDYKLLLSLSNSDHSALTWDEAAKKLGAGECAVNLMGDWAYGELINAGFEAKTDFGWVTFPGDEDIFDYVGDGFSIAAENVPNPEAAELWLKTLMDPDVQTAFAAKKGSIPALTTADTSSLSEYQQEAAASFAKAAVVSSLAHGQVATGEFSQTYADAVTTFNGDGNTDAFVATLSGAQASQLG